MKTISINTENSKTSEPRRFRLNLADKLNLKNPNKSIVLANLSICYTCTNIKSEYNKINFKFQHQLGMELLTYMMVLILFQICKITLSLLLRNMKL